MKPFRFFLPIIFGTLLLLENKTAAAPKTEEPIPFDSSTFTNDLLEKAGKLLAENKLISLRTMSQMAPLESKLALAPRATTRLETPDLYDKLLNSTVIVALYYRPNDSANMQFFSGAGFAVAKGGVFSTCAHMMNFNPKMMSEAYPVVIDYHGTVYPVSSVFALDPVADTCLLRVPGADFPPLPLRAGARTGESVYCLSHPGANLFMFTSGMVSRVDSRMDGARVSRILDVSCDYCPGSSGGPITDQAGNVVAQVDKIFPTLLQDDGSHVIAAAATVFNLHMATAADEIIRLADPANRAPLPAIAAAAVPSGEQNSFSVHSKFRYFEAPVALDLEKKVKSFDDLAAVVADKGSQIGTWDTAPFRETRQPNFLPAGFSASNSRYYTPPGLTLSMYNSIARGVDFKITYENLKDSTATVEVKVNDNRATPKAENHLFEVDSPIAQNSFKLIRLGDAYHDRQSWLALLVDDFDNAPALLPVSSLNLPADHKIDIKFTSTDGQQVDTAKMRGNVILVDFWATWCGPCMATLPIVEKIHDKYHAQGLEVIGVSLDFTKATLDTYLKAHPHPWPQSYEGAFGKNPLAARLGIEAIPVFMLIDKTGKATAIDVRNPNTDEVIAAMLKS